ncbi:reprolysin-like metallopeptidase [Chryseobacterium sp. OV279]|uniref:reprolysin-like metallopeptidase n=1 Tax=Chryseobacterium sp. OV279 TaxID=1500285 RepID=UPI000918D934|nr:zinc-dependent metalloprotease family protein [Chryseobacterium sp. OV279]SHF38663.1 Por secretion system C-terminal sorting domain-containing protein [Chryseobacterium sp. OV279]
MNKKLIDINAFVVISGNARCYNLSEEDSVNQNNSSLKFYFLALLLLIPFLGYSQWTETSLRAQKVKPSNEKLEYAALYSLDADQLKMMLKDAPERFSRSKGVTVSLPVASGKIEKFQVWESSNMDSELQKKYPDIKSYVGASVYDPCVYLRFSLSPVGFSSMITRSGITEFIEPYTEDRTVYAVFDSNAKRGQEKQPFECSVEETVEKSILENNKGIVSKKMAGFNVFRLALSCTGEYAQYHLTAAGTPVTATDGEKKAVILSAMNASLTRMNGVFEKDLSLHFNLIANNETIIFLDPTADPYINGGPNEAHTQISTRIAAADYDMGHLIDRKYASGAAGLGVICNDNGKGAGWTAHNFPEGDKFDIDYIAHEMGHQLGAGHSYTFRSSQADQKVEPGSGSTIMAYTGITEKSNVQFNSNDYFHTNSITQIKNKINSIACGVNTSFVSQAPHINAGADYIIPKSTAFVLKATTADAANAGYTYTWEQADQAAAAQIGAGNISSAYPTKPTGPTFRSFTPISSPVRYFPDFNKVLSGVLSTRWEAVSSVARNLNFVATVRNNNPVQPQVSKDAMIITVNAGSGPFQVTAPIFGQSLSSGGTASVTWDVANSNQAPVNTANVNVKLSTDGGQTFTVIAANTPNDGNEQLTIPPGSTSANAYILIEAVGNVYYAVSPSFVIDYNATGESCNTYTYSGAAVPIPDGQNGPNDGQNGPISGPKLEVPLLINNTGVVTRIKVIPSISHTTVRDLAIGIESPSGSSALIWDHQCNTQSGITAAFSDTGNAAICTSPIQGETKSVESLAIFKGHRAQGEWKLFVSDQFTDNIGTLNSWALEVCTRETQTLGTNDSSSPLSDDIKIYPNPNDGHFFIKSRNLKGEVKVVLFDSSGRLIHTSAYNSEGDSTKEFNINAPKGVYIININSSKGVYNSKLIIK